MDAPVRRKGGHPALPELRAAFCVSGRRKEETSSRSWGLKEPQRALLVCCRGANPTAGPGLCCDCRSLCVPCGPQGKAAQCHQPNSPCRCLSVTFHTSSFENRISSPLRISSTLFRSGRARLCHQSWRPKAALDPALAFQEQNHSFSIRK